MTFTCDYIYICIYMDTFVYKYVCTCYAFVSHWQRVLSSANFYSQLAFAYICPKHFMYTFFRLHFFIKNIWLCDDRHVDENICKIATFRGILVFFPSLFTQRSYWILFNSVYLLSDSLIDRGIHFEKFTEKLFSVTLV